MEPFVLQQEEFFTIKDWHQIPGLVAGFTTKLGGSSQGVFSSLNMGLHVHDSSEAVLKNRRQIAKQLGFPVEHWAGAEQTHEIHIENVTKQQRGKGALKYEESYKGTDGFFTQEKGIMLTMCYADCIPLYFFHPQSKSIGVVHAGWKGSVNGIAMKMVDKFKAVHVPLNEIQVVIGPGICEQCYVVDDRVITHVDKLLEDVDEKPYNLREDGQYHLNLKELNRQILIHAGLNEDNLKMTNYCTSCHHEYFFSHRRDAGKTGRMMSFIGWKEDSLS
ncbi:peptidoglycan editing factor PgeF [Cytobacillus purgationiresistens]|uniref:Purine nucleoside phosphorylase n=1 Tax=Cytobacillus purgationiresistens TaxID=863449 RepID=A0ABU0AJT5_9BACI|nr:peptidoglycan editing factor PgeF [Cytobacillus purgationiresistens]MDQ0270320.1 YfiH family protein [Cytobacillus purgationiresistens]